MADVNPTVEDVAGKEKAVRELFAEKHKDDIAKGKYDQRDIDRLNSSDAYARCFLRTLKSKGNPKKAVDVIHECFTFRKDMDLWALTEDMFPDELIQKKAIRYDGKDREGHPILYLQVQENNVNNKEEAIIQRRWIAYNFEKHHRENPEQMCVVLLDMSGASTGNVNTDTSKYLIQCFTTNFPTYLAYAINYEMPTIINAVWAIISAFLNAEQKRKLLTLKKKEIGKYIDDNNLLPHMK